MPLPVYNQYVFAVRNGIFAGALEFRINTDGSLLYNRATPSTETLFVDSPCSITNVAELRKKFNDKDGDLSADEFNFNVYDLAEYSGHVGDPVTGTPVTENLAANNGSLWDKICFNETNGTQLICWITLFKQDGTREPFFIGTIDPLQIPRTHLSVWFPNTVNEVQTRELQLQAVDLMSLIKTKTINDLLNTILTTQTYDGITIDLNYFTDRKDYWFAGIRWDSSGGITSAFQGDVGREVGHMTDPTSGLRSISLNQLILALEVTIGYFLNFALGIDSSFDFYNQTYSAPGYPLALVSNVSSLELIWNEIFGKAIVDLPRYAIASASSATSKFTTTGANGMFSTGQPVKFVVTGGGGSLPAPIVAGTTYYFIAPPTPGTTFQVAATLADALHAPPIFINLTTNGSAPFAVYDATGDFPYKNAWDRTAPLSDLLKKISIQFGTIFYTQIIDTTGLGDYNPYLRTKARRTKFGNVPAAWQLIDSKEEPHYITQTAITVSNDNDNLKIQAGILANQSDQALDLSIAWRAHQWGDQNPNSNDTDSLVPDAAKWFDKSLAQSDQGNCFASSLDTAPAPSNDADAWQGATFLYNPYLDVSSIYHRAFPGQGAHAGEVGIAACTIKGAPAPKDGDDFYNTLRAPAIFYYQEMIGPKIVLSRKYYGVLAEDGTVQGVRPGLETILDIRVESNGGSNRTFRAIETSQNFMSNTTEGKFIERPSDYTLSTIPPIMYVSQAGGTSSTASSTSVNASGSSSSTTNQWTNTRKIEDRIVNFYQAGVVIESISMSIIEYLDATNNTITAQFGVPNEFDGTTPPYGFNDFFVFKKKATEHGNVEVVGLSATGVPDYWADSISSSKLDLLGLNSNVYYALKNRYWSEDIGKFINQNNLECANPNRRVFVKGIFKISWAGGSGFGSATWLNMSDTTAPMSDREILKASLTTPFGFDVDYSTSVNPVATPAGTNGIQVNFGTRLMPVAINCMAWKLGTAPGTAGSFEVFAMPVLNGRDAGGANVNSVLLEFGVRNYAGPAPFVIPYANNAVLNTAMTEFASVLYVDLFGLCEIKGEDARTS